MKTWLKQRRAKRQLRREEGRARERFFRAHYAYQDTAVVLGDAPGAWSSHGAVGQAQDEVVARMNELKQVQADLRRAEQVGQVG